MNLRQFSLALLISALPLIGLADHSVDFNEGDFRSATQVTKDGETVLKLKLSKSGKAKIKRLSSMKGEKHMQTDIAGISSRMKLRVPITGEGIQIGPFKQQDAKKILKMLND